MIALGRNERLSIDGVVWAVERRTPQGYQMVGVGDGTLKSFAMDELLEAFNGGRLRRHAPPANPNALRQLNPPEHDFSARSSSEIATARIRDNVIRHIQSRSPGTTCSDADILAVLRDQVLFPPGGQKPPSLRTVRRWLLRAKISGGCIDALVPRKRGKKGTRIDETVEAIIGDVIDEVILRPEAGTGPIAYSLIFDRITRHNNEHPQFPLPYPSRATIFRRIEAIDDYERICAREGRRKADQKYAPVGHAPLVHAPMREVEIDHGFLDCIAVTADGLPLGRPYITFALDRATRMIVGFVITFVAPSFASVMMVLRRMIADKRYVKTLFGGKIQNEWPCFGLPETIIVDNGPEFHSENLRVACEQLGRIEIVYTPTRDPKYKGKIERFFGTLNEQLIHFLPGTTFHKVDRERDYDPAGAAQFTLDEINEKLHRLVIDVYHKRYHRGLKDVPLDAWKTGIEKHPLRLARSIDDLDALSAGIETRKIGRMGIELFGLFYLSNELVDLRIKTKGKIDVEVRYDPLDLGTIFVKHPFEPRLIRVPSTNQHVAGLSKWHHEAVLKTLGTKARNASDADYHRAVADLHADALAKTKGRKKKIAGRQAARVLEKPDPVRAKIHASAPSLDDVLGALPAGVVQSSPQPLSGEAGMPLPMKRRQNPKKLRMEEEKLLNVASPVPEGGGHAEDPCGDDLESARVSMGISVKRYE